MTPPLSHPSPSVRALQAQFLHPASGSRPRRTSTLATTTKRRRGISSQSDESVHSADLTGEEDEEEEEEEDSDFTGEEEASHPMPKRAKTGTRGKPLFSLDAHEKRLRRQQQNRDAAATSRNRKKQHLALLEQRSASLEAENHQLKQQLREQQKQITLMRLQLDALTHAHPQRTIVPTEQVRRYSAPSSPDSGHTYSAPSTPVEDSSVGSSPAIHPAQLNVTVAPLALDEDLVESDHFSSLIHSPRLTQKTVSLPTLPLHSLPPVASRSTPITHRVESYPSPAPSSVVAPSPYSNVFAAEFTRGSTLVASAPTPRRQPSSLPLGSSVSSSSVFVGASTSASPIDPLPRSLESHDPAAIVTSDVPLCASLGNLQCCSRVSFEAPVSMQLNRSSEVPTLASSKMIPSSSSDSALLAVSMLALMSAQWLTTALFMTLSSEAFSLINIERAINHAALVPSHLRPSSPHLSSLSLVACT